MTALRVIFGDQLSHSISSLSNINKQDDIVLICEVGDEATYVKHHPKKIAFFFASMRHFAQELMAQNINVRYIKFDDIENSGSFAGEISRAIKELSPHEVIFTEPGEYRVLEIMRGLKNLCKFRMKEDNRFLATKSFFENWAKDKKQYRMEYFYREMRKKYKILLAENEKPLGGKWNFDKENRSPPIEGLKSPKRISHKKSEITLEVIDLVKSKFSNNFGDLEPFHFAVNRKEALKELDQFIDEILPNFGTYQDAMVKDEAFLYHSLISSYLNIGLLLPLEICQKAEESYRQGKSPLNAVEGFIRQILGWREFIRGMYWKFMPDYSEMNYLNAKRPLPSFYWGADTNMFCVKEALSHTQKFAYSHHIQRLMVTGNFALIAGLDIKEVTDWYLAVYSDAIEWVELPNTLGMALFADGGLVASKPYAASGKYINRMSDYCKNCFYNPNEMLGEKACPFNALYWDFMARNEDKFRNNQRMPFVFSNWDKFGNDYQEAIKDRAKSIFEKMDNSGL